MIKNNEVGFSRRLNDVIFICMINLMTLTYLDVNLNSRNRLRDNKIYSSFIITATSQKSLDILIKYLTKYPLLSSKYLDFLDWSEIIDFIKKKGNNNVPGGSWELASIKRKDFNKTRTTFTWKHLNSTYIGM